MEKRLRSSLSNSADEFIKSVAKSGFKSSKSSLKTLIHSLNPSSPLISTLPSSLHHSISQSIATFNNSIASNPLDDAKSPPTKRHRRSSRLSNADDNDDDSGTDAKREALKHSVVENLQICTHLLFLCASHPKKVFSPSDLLVSVRCLHDNLVLFEFDDVLMSEISCLCEEWWKEDFPERETLISLSMPLLLSRSLTLKRKVDVHRVYALREAFACFDFDDESIEDLKRLLLRCFIEPLYLKTDDGKKFLAFLFELDKQLVKEALLMIRSQISTGRKSTLEAYAEIVFKAWKVVEDEESKYDIENRFLQELIDSCIHSSSGQFSSYIRRILGGFISQRTNHDVEKLLFRLSEPLIFRSLEVHYLFWLNTCHLF